MTSRELLRWSRLHERRAHRGITSWAIVAVAAAGFAALVYWRLHDTGPLAASRSWLGGALVVFALAFMRVPFHVYWRQDAALLAQLPIGGGALFDAALLRCVRGAAQTAIVVGAGALPLLEVDGQLAVRHLALTLALFALAAGFMPAVATWAASLVTRSRDVLELAMELGGAPVQQGRRREDGDSKRPTAGPPGASSAILGALPGFAATVVIVLVIIASPWLVGRDAALPAPVVLGALGAVSLATVAAMRSAAPRVMGTILRDVSALDRQRLATLEIRPPTALESAVARLLGDAGLVYRKDARLMRRRYPMAFALGALAFLVLAIVGLSRPDDPAPWLVAVLAGAAVYGVALAGRLRRSPIEIPRLAATLPIAPAAITRAKLAWIATWTCVFVLVPLVFAALRLL